jgi:hypothetical protein
MPYSRVGRRESAIQRVVDLLSRVPRRASLNRAPCACDSAAGTKVSALLVQGDADVDSENFSCTLEHPMMAWLNLPNTPTSKCDPVSLRRDRRI